jgi:hypothetical protein
MSTFNKLFSGCVLAASVLVLLHTATWAWSSSRAVDEAQAAEVAPVLALSANGSGAPRPATTDSCAGAEHAVAP